MITSDIFFSLIGLKFGENSSEYKSIQMKFMGKNKSPTPTGGHEEFQCEKLCARCYKNVKGE